MNPLRSDDAVDFLEALGIPVKDKYCRSVDIHFDAGGSVTADVRYWVQKPNSKEMETITKKYRMELVEPAPTTEEVIKCQQ